MVLIIKILFLVAIWLTRSRHSGSNVTPDTQSLTIDKFLNAVELENPIRFTSQQLSIATDNFTHLLVSGGSGALYKLQRDFWQQNQCVSEDFTWKLGLRTVHQKGPSFWSGLGLRFCSERDLRALVYEYMVNGSLENYLFCKKTS